MGPKWGRGSTAGLQADSGMRRRPRQPNPRPRPGRGAIDLGCAFGLAVAGLLLLHYAVAAHSLLQENPTVDEVVHLPAGVTYWQKRTFKLYHHNPPLVKLVAALPVVLSGAQTADLYKSRSWTSREPDQATFAHLFARANAKRYFELFAKARLVMPVFSVIAGLVVFAWSRRLYGPWGGLLSLVLWVICPNVLAHSRLITTDMGSTALCVAATYVFWSYLQKPGWLLAAAAGVLLGLAQLTKFSMLLLYAIWPVLWLLQTILVPAANRWLARTLMAVAQGLMMVAISVLLIDAGYLFEGVGIPLGQYEFGSAALMRPVKPGTGTDPPSSPNPYYNDLLKVRVNRFRDTSLAQLRCPLPEHYVRGFDEQKIEAEGIPERFVNIRPEDVDRILRQGETTDQAVSGYPVYLNGQHRRSGWWYYYICTLLYKVPEGTWLLVLLSLAAGVATIRSRPALAQELAVWTIPCVLLFSMSFLTDINLGLRYVLGIFPFVFIATGKVVPWIVNMRAVGKALAATVAAGALALSIAATISIHPHHLAYFNWVSGGTERVPPRLIDSNLDWGQDLVGLQKWWKKKAIPDERIGLVYFGQINPSLFALRGEPFAWFLPPIRAGLAELMARKLRPMLEGPAPKLTPGYYAVSKTVLFGLPWRYYDPVSLDKVPPEVSRHMWNVRVPGAFNYFRLLRVEHTIGHSINIYKVSAADAARINAANGFGGGDQMQTRVASPMRLGADVDLGQIGVADRSEKDFGLEACLQEDLRQVGAEFGKDGVSPVASGMGDAHP